VPDGSAEDRVCRKTAGSVPISTVRFALCSRTAKLQSCRKTNAARRKARLLEPIRRFACDGA
jgi:hypothetical protein